MSRQELGKGNFVPPIVTQPIAVKKVEDSIRKEVTTQVGAQLGIAGQLPAEVGQVIEAATKAAAAKSVELTIAQVTEEAAKNLTRGSVLDRFDDKIKVAADSIGHISQSDDVDQVLKRRAELLAKKRKALVDAGFSNDEAMKILLADVNSRNH